MGANRIGMPRRPVLRVVETGPVGTYEFPSEPDIDVTAGLTKIYAVRVNGCVWQEFDTASNAARCASALRELARLGAFPSPRECARRMLAAVAAETHPEPPNAA